MSDNAIGGFTVPLVAPTPDTPPRVSLRCPDCTDLTFPSFPTRSEAQHIAGQHNLIAHGRANIATADPEPDADTRALFARAEAGDCIAFDGETQYECGEPTEEGSRYCRHHSIEASDAGEEFTLADWRKELAQQELDYTDGLRIAASQAEEQRITAERQAERTARTAYDQQPAEAGAATGPQCDCCDMRHGMQLAPGEHCDWCRRGLRHRMLWAVRGSVGR